MEAIESVLQQSFRDWELIIIDDASADDSWKLIANYDDKRIRSLRHTENQGAHRTINEGLGLAKGEYLTILNSDDSYAPDRLERLYHHATVSGAAFLATRVQPIAADGTLADDPNSHWNSWYTGLLDAYRETDRLLTGLC
ncbi:MAG: glycosyltransferase family 2 protein, partial [Candidatus Thiodiazotropha sp.]